MTNFMIVGAPGSGTRWMRSAINGLFKTDETYKFPGLNAVTSEHQTYKITQALEEGFKVIHLVRDGRSQIISRILAKHGFDDGMIKEFRIKVPEKKHLNYAITWNMFVELGMRGRGHENYIEIKYEDFCLKPVGTVNKISRFLEIKYDTENLEKIREKIEPSLGKYNQFNLKVLEEINEIIKENMEKLGYGMEK